MSNKKDNYKEKNRWFNVVLYQEDPMFKRYMTTLEDLYTMVTYIDHDKDTLEDGTPKKPHRHVMFYVGGNARHVAAIAKETGIPQNMLAGCNKDAMLLYFIHYNQTTKYLYDIRGGTRTAQRKPRRTYTKANKRKQKTEKLYGNTRKRATENNIRFI